jgi:hypothetical protein
MRTAGSTLEVLQPGEWIALDGRSLAGDVIAPCSWFQHWETGYDTFYWTKLADTTERVRFLEFAHMMVRHAIARGPAKLRLVRRTSPRTRKDRSIAKADFSCPRQEG